MPDLEVKSNLADPVKAVCGFARLVCRDNASEYERPAER